MAEKRRRGEIWPIQELVRRRRPLLSIVVAGGSAAGFAARLDWPMRIWAAVTLRALAAFTVEFVVSVRRDAVGPISSRGLDRGAHACR